MRKECEEVKVKLLDYEKMSKFQRVMSTDSEVEGYKVSGKSIANIIVSFLFCEFPSFYRRKSPS